jgi:mannose-6-phosphate isomerase
MGAHPSAPSAVERDGRHSTLDAVIAADPGLELGRECVARFGSRLPFLLKVLSADQALSIQVHPSRAQAEAGFRADNERGLASGDPARNYADNWPKPELLCALTPFEVLAGLRAPADAAGILRALAVEQLRPLEAELAAAAPGPAGAPTAGRRVIAGVLRSILNWPAASHARLVHDVVAACARMASTGGPYADACAAAVRVAADHPGDVGVVALLLLRHAVLQPGQAVFMPAGGLHAYLRGTGIEVLANSDNVVRACLTGKHVDVPELLKLLDPAVVVPILSPCPVADGITRYDTPTPEFCLYRLDLGPEAIALPGAGPRILLCTEGAVVLRSQTGDTVEMRRGESCFVSAADVAMSGTGPARAFLASPGAGS